MAVAYDRGRLESAVDFCERLLPKALKRHCERLNSVYEAAEEELVGIDVSLSITFKAGLET